MNINIEQDILCRNILHGMIKEFGYQYFISRIPKAYPKIYQYIDSRFLKLAGHKFAEKCYWILNELSDFPKCPVCGNDVKGFINSAKGYSPCCSYSCGSKYKLLKIVGRPLFEISEANDTDFRKKILQLNLDFHRSTFVSHFISKLPEALNYVYFRYECLKEKDLSEKMYWFINGLDDFPKCTVCGRPTQFRNIVIGYSSHCPRCIMKDSAVQEKISESRKNALAADPDRNRKIDEKRKRTKLAKYGNPTWNNRVKSEKTFRRNHDGQRWTSEMTAKMKNTLALRHGNPHWNNQDAMRRTCVERYGVESYSQTPEFLEKVKQKNMLKLGVEFPGQSEECQKKIRQTCMAKYGVQNYAQSEEYKANWKNPEFVRKRQTRQYETKRKNGTFNTSRPENTVKNALMALFGEDCVICQYSDSVRYPFACDFYIKPLDLFIECNFHWTHCGHFFDKHNVDDISKLNKLKVKAAEKQRTQGKNLYETAIDVWTMRDPKKLHTALKNRLNYLVFWTLDEALDWLKSK